MKIQAVQAYSYNGNLFRTEGSAHKEMKQREERLRRTLLMELIKELYGHNEINSLETMMQRGDRGYEYLCSFAMADHIVKNKDVIIKYLQGI